MSRENKQLQIWEFIVILILEIAMFTTMFIPIFHFNKNVVDNMSGKLQEATIEGVGNLIDEVIDKVPGGEALLGLSGTSKEDVVKELAEEIDFTELGEEFEEVHISVSPASIITHSFVGLVCKIVDEDPSEVKAEDIPEQLQPAISAYNFLRVLIILIYVFDVILIILSIITFCAKINKLIAGLLNALYGFFMAVGIFFTRFVGMKMVIKSAATQMTSMLGGIGSILGELSDLESLAPGASETIEKAVNKLISKYISIVLNGVFTINFVLQILFGLALLVMGVVIIINSAKKSGVSGDFAGGDWPVDGGFTPQNETGSGEWGPQQQLSVNDFYDPNNQTAATSATAATAATDFTASATMGAMTPPPAMPSGQIFCTKGNSAGRSISLNGNTKVIVGKSQTRANFIIDYPHVSNIHCSICYNPDSNTYTVKDHSTNGTFVNGQQLPKEQPVNLASGTVLSLADGYNQITLGKNAGGASFQQAQPFAQPFAQPVNQGFAQPMPGGKITGVSGVAAGKVMQVPAGGNVVIGKSQNRANFIVDNPHVSNVHCLVSYNAATNSYMVTDQSSNGTKINGVPMPKGVAQTVPAGTVLSLADANNQVRLG